MSRDGRFVGANRRVELLDQRDLLLDGLSRDRFFGGGFMIWTDSVFRAYAPVPDDVHAAHSIYFQVLGEHGFVGLLLFFSIAVLTWLAAQRLVRQGAVGSPVKWAADLGAMVQVSMVGYAVGGAFLSLAYFDLPYNLMIATVVAASIVRKAGSGEAVAAGHAVELAGQRSRGTMA